jgi:hypothetical protein
MRAYFQTFKQKIIVTGLTPWGRTHNFVQLGATNTAGSAIEAYHGIGEALAARTPARRPSRPGRKIEPLAQPLESDVKPTLINID